MKKNNSVEQKIQMKF